MRAISLLSVPVSVAAVVAFSAPAASAEGQVEQGPQNANSICSYSGLNDEPGAAYPEGGRVQSYGQLVRLKVIIPRETRNTGESPGSLCNAHNLPWQDITGSH